MRYCLFKKFKVPKPYEFGGPKPPIRASCLLLLADSFKLVWWFGQLRGSAGCLGRLYIYIYIYRERELCIKLYKYDQIWLYSSTHTPIYIYTYNIYIYIICVCTPVMYPHAPAFFIPMSCLRPRGHTPNCHRESTGAVGTHRWPPGGSRAHRPGPRHWRLVTEKQDNPPTPAFAKAGAAPGTTGGVELGSFRQTFQTLQTPFW